MWLNFAVESSPSRQVPSLGLFPCSPGWLFIGGEIGVRFRKPQQAAAASCCCWLQCCSDVAWLHLSAALFLPSTALLCCADCRPTVLLAEPRARCMTGFAPFQRECAVEAFPAQDRAWAHLGKAELQQQQVPVSPCWGGSSWLLPSVVSHDEVHINSLKVEWKHCENIPRVVVRPLWGHCHLH